MLSDEEKKFIDYWEKNREKQKKFLWQLAIGLPAGCLFAVAIFLNMVSGWHISASTVINSSPSLIFVMIAAVLLIVVFIAVYTVKHRWDMNEQRYKELGGNKNQDISS